MKLFDVMVFDAKRMQDVVYQSSVVKRDAKKLMKELQSKGFKSHVLTSKPNRAGGNLQLDDTEPESGEE